MERSKVYFTPMANGMKESMPAKLRRLALAAGIGNIDFENKFTAIKIHFGEEGNVAYLRHNYAREIVKIVKEKGGRVFLTDCNTLYVGSRTNALDHLDCAAIHGYNPLTVGCNVIIADGLKGTDETLVPIDGEYVKEAKIGTAVMDADIIISLTHFKAHEEAGIGGALKNIGMGCGSRAGKMEMHCSGAPAADPDLCIGCGICADNCGQDAIEIVDGKAVVTERCAGCGRCIGRCPMNAMHPVHYDAAELLSKRISEYAWAVVKDRPAFHIALAIDISPFCDCHSINDVPIVPDIGMFASFDPVALDQACADAVNAQRPTPDSFLTGKHSHRHHDHDDHFIAMHPDAEWEAGLEHAEKLGMGTRSYELVEI